MIGHSEAISDLTVAITILSANKCLNIQFANDASTADEAEKEMCSRHKSC